MSEEESPTVTKHKKHSQTSNETEGDSPDKTYQKLEASIKKMLKNTLSSTDCTQDALTKVSEAMNSEDRKVSEEEIMKEKQVLIASCQNITYHIHAIADSFVDFVEEQEADLRKLDVELRVVSNRLQMSHDILGASGLRLGASERSYVLASQTHSGRGKSSAHNTDTSTTTSARSHTERQKLKSSKSSARTEN